MNRNRLLGLLTFVLIGCNKNEPQDSLMLNNHGYRAVSDSSYIVNPLFLLGDARRYGLLPNTPVDQKKLNNVIKLTEAGLILNFPEGIYNTDLIIKGKENLTLVFDNTTLSGTLQIIDDNDKPSKNIVLKGHLKVLDKVFIRNAQNIAFDTLSVVTDTLNSLHKKMNRGVSIYAGVKDVSFNTLNIVDTGGSSDDFYKFSAAALQVHGWNNNPERITIENLYIEGAERTGAYLTGNEHKIKKAIIKNYAQGGTTNNMFGLEDADPGSEREFAGFWINKCNNCDIDSLEVSNNFPKPFSLKFGIGVYSAPSIINYLGLKEQSKEAPIEDHLLTNVLVKHEY